MRLLFSFDLCHLNIYVLFRNRPLAYLIGLQNKYLRSLLFVRYSRPEVITLLINILVAGLALRLIYHNGPRKRD